MASGLGSLEGKGENLKVSAQLSCRIRVTWPDHWLSASIPPVKWDDTSLPPWLGEVHSCCEGLTYSEDGLGMG